jgi:hypothetical protein
MGMALEAEALRDGLVRETLDPTHLDDRAVGGIESDRSKEST